MLADGSYGGETRLWTAHKSNPQAPSSQLEAGEQALPQYHLTLTYHSGKMRHTHLKERHTYMAKRELTFDEKYVIDRTLALAREWGLEGGNVQVRKRRNSSAWGKHPKYGWQIFYGINDVWATARYGMTEYATVEHMLSDRGLDTATGRLALDILVAHEFAHVVNRQVNGHSWKIEGSYYKGYRRSQEIKPHGDEWREIYGQLLDQLLVNEASFSNVGTAAYSKSTNNSPQNWIVRVYDERSRVIKSWAIVNRTEDEARSEAEAEIEQHYPDASDWTLT